MIIVRFPNGAKITYSNANYVIDKESCTDLYTEKGGKWLASIQNSLRCIIESESAKHTPESSNVRNYDHRALQELKRELSNYNCNTREWK